MTTRFFSILAAALSLSLSAGFVAPTHAAPVSVGFRQHKLAEAPRQNQLNLTDEQRDRIKEIRDSAQQNIMNNVLTDEQRQMIQTASINGQKPRQIWSSLNLTEEQKNKIREIRRSAQQKVYNEVLTADQKQQVEQMRQQRRSQTQQQ